MIDTKVVDKVQKVEEKIVKPTGKKFFSKMKFEIKVLEMAGIEEHIEMNDCNEDIFYFLFLYCKFKNSKTLSDKEKCFVLAKKVYRLIEKRKSSAKKQINKCEEILTGIIVEGKKYNDHYEYQEHLLEVNKDNWKTIKDCNNRIIYIKCMIEEILKEFETNMIIEKHFLRLCSCNEKQGLSIIEQVDKCISENKGIVENEDGEEDNILRRYIMSGIETEDYKKDYLDNKSNGTPYHDILWKGKIFQMEDYKDRYFNVNRKLIGRLYIRKIRKECK